MADRAADRAPRIAWRRDRRKYARAADAAASANYAIECDIQLTADGELVVFHDDTLERLTAAGGTLQARTLADLKALPIATQPDGFPSSRNFSPASPAARRF